MRLAVAVLAALLFHVEPTRAQSACYQAEAFLREVANAGYALAFTGVTERGSITHVFLKSGKWLMADLIPQGRCFVPFDGGDGWEAVKDAPPFTAPRPDLR